MPMTTMKVIGERLKTASPLVQNITNTVVQQFTANVLLAIGASPAMLDHEADAAQFTHLAQALLINFGTASNQQLLAADVAVETANNLGKPWVLDPVSAGAGDFRTSKIRQILTKQPTVVRGNASEIMLLANAGQGGRGVDATDEVDVAIPAATALARDTNSIIAISGQYDAIVMMLDNRIHIARVHGGHPLMAAVVGTGCSLGAVTAAYLGIPKQVGKQDYFNATLAAHAHFALAGHMAAKQANAPGSFAVAFLDALYELTPDDFLHAHVDTQTQALD